MLVVCVQWTSALKGGQSCRRRLEKRAWVACLQQQIGEGSTACASDVARSLRLDRDSGSALPQTLLDHGVSRLQYCDQSWGQIFSALSLVTRVFHLVYRTSFFLFRAVIHQEYQVREVNRRGHIILKCNVYAGAIRVRSRQIDAHCHRLREVTCPYIVVSAKFLECDLEVAVWTRNFIATRPSFV